MHDERTRKEMVEVSRALHARGWVANHDGNASARLASGHLLCTPTAVSKGDVTPESLIVVDEGGQVLAGARKPFSELRLHRAAYAARPDIGVVLHAHPPTATGFAVAGLSLGPAFLAEPVVSLGEDIPLVPFGLVGDAALDAALAAALSRADAVLLANHGVITVAPDLPLALLRMELVEHLAKIALVARQLGGARPIPREAVSTLLDQRAKAGLGPKSAPAAEAGPTLSYPTPGRADAREVSRLVEETLRRFGS